MNKEKISSTVYLKRQLELGLNPQWFITYHYFTPDEIKHNEKKSVWKAIPYYSYITKRRTDYDAVVKDTSHIRNVLYKDLYEIKRPEEYWKYEFPNVIFHHEKGKSQSKYHTHLILPECINHNEEKQLTLYMNSTFKKKVKCISHNRIHVEKIYNPSGILKYLNKETFKEHSSLDWINSNFIQAETCKELHN